MGHMMPRQVFCVGESCDHANRTPILYADIVSDEVRRSEIETTRLEMPLDVRFKRLEFDEFPVALWTITFHRFVYNVLRKGQITISKTIRTTAACSSQ